MTRWLPRVALALAWGGSIVWATSLADENFVPAAIIATLLFGLIGGGRWTIAAPFATAAVLIVVQTVYVATGAGDSVEDLPIWITFVLDLLFATLAAVLIAFAVIVRRATVRRWRVWHATGTDSSRLRVDR